MKLKNSVFVFSVFLSSSLNAELKSLPKYAPTEKPVATLLKNDRKHIQSKDAPDFWALMPYYFGMHVDHSASAASLASVLNALRQNTQYTSDIEMITNESLLKKVKAEGWAKKISGKKPVGVNLEEFAKISQAALTAYGVSSAKAEAMSVNDSSKETTEKIKKLLMDNEKNDKSFVIAHYIQSAFTGDPEGAVGTYSTVAAYDSVKEQVLILETDRKYYEPYWVSLSTFIEGLSGLKNSKTQKAEGGLVSFTAL